MSEIEREREEKAIVAALLLFLHDDPEAPRHFPAEQEYLLSALAGAVHEYCTGEALSVGYHHGEKMVYPKFEGQIFKIVNDTLDRHRGRLPLPFAERIVTLIRPDWRPEEPPGRESWTLLYEFYNGNASGRKGFCPSRGEGLVPIAPESLAEMRALRAELSPETRTLCRRLAHLMARYLTRDIEPVGEEGGG